MLKNYVFMMLLFVCSISLAQTPEKMTYQAIVRNAEGNLVSNTEVGVQISILKTSTSGNAVFAETHLLSTNENGLVSLEIGVGSVVSGSFADIDWGSDTYYIKSEIDPSGGSNYTISGTSQLLSVPYALHAKKAENVPSYKIGDMAYGGIVFWVDNTGQHGLVCSKENLTTATRWFAGTFGNTQAKGNGIYSGKSNTAIIIAAQTAMGDDGDEYAARLCNEYGVVDDNVLYGGWYLPSLFELNLIFQNIIILNNVATSNGGEAFINDFYWSSTEESINRAWIFNLLDAQQTNVLKGSQNPVRAVRSF